MSTASKLSFARAPLETVGGSIKPSRPKPQARRYLAMLGNIHRVAPFAEADALGKEPTQR